VQIAGSDTVDEHVDEVGGAHFAEDPLNDGIRHAAEGT
jgi:hypothetical protein